MSIALPNEIIIFKFYTTINTIYLPNSLDVMQLWTYGTMSYIGSSTSDMEPLPWEITDTL